MIPHFEASRHGLDQAFAAATDMAGAAPHGRIAVLSFFAGSA
jgi:hypothetical protein